jgi:S-DNA-T family DNA segregation ATPase FtsK/SpoIIIE
MTLSTGKNYTMVSRKIHHRQKQVNPYGNKSTLSKIMKRWNKKTGNMKLEVDSKISKEIGVILLAILLLFTFLSRTGSMGQLGDIWYTFLLYAIGLWGMYLFMLVFSLVTLCLIFAPRFQLNFTRSTGLFLLFISVLGYIGLSGNIETVDDPTKLIMSLGGYVGFVVNLGFKSVVGEMGTRIILFGLFLIAILLIFQRSFLDTLAWIITPRPKKEKAVAAKVQKEKETEDQFIIKGLDAHIDKVINKEKEKIKQKEPALHIKTGMEQASKKDDTFKKQAINRKQEQQWEFPSLDLLHQGSSEVIIDKDLLTSNAEKIKDKLAQFNINVVMRDLNVGPTVMQYTLEPDEGVKLSKITTLKDDLALALSAKSIRIEAPIPGKPFVGIEIPNEKRMIVHLREILESKEFFDIKSHLRFPLGKDVSGKPLIDALDFMPHLLIAGATGSGKSVAINSFLISLLYQNSPKDLKLILVDPKRVELSSYNNLPHLLTPVITDPDKAINALRWTVAEMTRRYKECQHVGARNRDEYNKKATEENKMPYIIFVVDELADLMMTSFKKEVETLIARIAQMARAVGIHLVIATQRPSVNVITGIIKANIPARMAFSVVQSVDSRTILDSIGAEDLIGKGDMLYLSSNMSKPVRIQGVFVGSEEIEKVTTQIRMTIEPDYNEAVTENKKGIDVGNMENIPVADGSEDMTDDQLVQQAIQIIRETGKASASLFQRRMKLGYARAARIIDILEEQGAVGPVMGSKPREIYIDHKGSGPQDDPEE